MRFICSMCGDELPTEQDPEIIVICPCQCICIRIDDMQDDLVWLKSVVEGLR